MPRRKNPDGNGTKAEVERFSALAERTVGPLREFSKAVGRHPIACMDEPQLFDGLRHGGAPTLEYRDRATEASIVCCVCPMRPACEKYARQVSPLLEHGSIVAGYIVFHGDLITLDELLSPKGEEVAAC